VYTNLSAARAVFADANAAQPRAERTQSARHDGAFECTDEPTSNSTTARCENQTSSYSLNPSQP